MPAYLLDALEGRRHLSTTIRVTGGADGAGLTLADGSGAGTVIINDGSNGTPGRIEIRTLPLLAPARLDGDTLIVEGTKNADLIKPRVADGKIYFTNSLPSGRFAFADVTVVPTDTAGGTIFVSDDADPIGVTKYDLSAIKKIVLNLGDGADSVDLSSLNVPTEVHGGAGRDTIVGGTANDTLYGDAGDDVVNGGRGDDVLVGGSGDDLLTSRKGRDTLLGNAGDDRLYAYAAKAALDGGTGTDIGLLQAAPDGVTGVETTSSRSRYGVTPVDARVYGVTATLRKSGSGLALDTSVTLSDAGWAVDFDLVQNSSGTVVVNATAYRTTGGAGQALTPSRTTFELEQSLARRPVKINITENGRDLLSGTVLVGPTFASKTLREGEFAYDVTAASSARTTKARRDEGKIWRTDSLRVFASL